MATGFARGSYQARGRRIAFGDGQKIIWSDKSEAIFQGNPNIAPPGSERDGDIDWMHFYLHHRLYGTPYQGHWRWNKSFSAVPGEIFLTETEKRWAEYFGEKFILIEPNVKHVAPNKQWPVERYQELADHLMAAGERVIQFDAGISLANTHWYLGNGVKIVSTPSFRHALALLARARLYIGPEGGLHHGCAALGVPAVVIFGGFIPPSITGYDGHANLIGDSRFCGTIGRLCQHCVQAMNVITVDQVWKAARSQIECKAE